MIFLGGVVLKTRGANREIRKSQPCDFFSVCDLQRIRKRGRQKACGEIAGVLMQLNKGGPGLLLIGIL